MLQVTPDGDSWNAHSRAGTKGEERLLKTQWTITYNSHMCVRATQVNHVRTSGLLQRSGLRATASLHGVIAPESGHLCSLQGRCEEGLDELVGT